MPEIEWGTVEYTEHYHGPKAGKVTINRADPNVLVLDEILHLALDGNAISRWSTLRLQPAPDTGWCDGGPGVCEYPSHPFCFTGWILHVDILGRHLVYRIGKYRAATNNWEASWPD